VSFDVFLLLVISAVAHAGWNFLARSAADRAVFLWMAVGAASLLALPLVVTGDALSREAWLIAGASGAIEALYFATLARAYRAGDFSLIYPMIRGVAPMLVALWAWLLLDQEIAVIGFAGIALVVSGLVFMGYAAWSRGIEHHRIAPRQLAVALAVPIIVSTASTVEAAGVRHADPLAFGIVTLAIATLLRAPAFLTAPGRRRVRAELAVSWKRPLAAGLCVIAAFALSLVAMRRAPAGYVVAVREMSIVIAVIAGWRFLDESQGVLRLIASIVILAGVALIVLAR
jgi:drug/metabolite transporter (DMT)-like permease